MNYWRWLLRGTTGAPGYKLLFDRWALFHLTVGVLLAWVVPMELKEAATTVLLPLAGLFVGLCFAWGGNAQALLQTEEIEKLAKHHPGGLEHYAYVYQTAILEVLVALVFWGIAGLNVFDRCWPTSESPRLYFMVKALVFVSTSWTLRECWHVVLGAQSLLLTRNRIRGELPAAEKPSRSGKQGG